MKLVYRRIMFWVSVVIFFTLGPSLIFYAQGYRIVPKDRAIVTTGTLVVSSRPVNASIRLNGEILPFSTPYTIDSLNPGEHLIELFHDDYLTWSKRLIVKENQSTFVSDVRLVKDSSPKKSDPADYIFYDPVSRRGYLTFKQSDDGLQASFKRSQVLSGLLLSNREALIPVSETSRVSVVAWQGSDDRLILETDERVWLLDFSITDQPVKELTAVIPPNYKSIHWSTRNADELLVTNSNSITLVNLANITKREIPNTSLSAEVFSDAFTSGNSIYAIMSTDQSSRLVSLNLTGVISEISQLNGTHSKFIAQDNNVLILKSRGGELLVYHINGDGFRPGYSFGYVEEVLYDSDNNDLLFTTGTELYTYNIKQDQLNLLVRQAKPISGLDWFEDSHVTYVSDSSVYLIERDGRNGHINWLLAESVDSGSYFINNSFNKLFFVTQQNAQKFVFERDI